MSIIVETPFQNFTGLDGKPLTNGKVYIGQVGTDPTVFANQIPVFWDEALTIPASQPLTTSAGYIVRTGTPARVWVATDYSISVKNSSNVLVYYISEFGVVDLSIYAKLSDLIASSGSSLIGYIIDGVGGVFRTLKSKLQGYVDVYDFGVVGDGVADDTANMKKALDHGAIKKLVVRGLGALVRITGPLTITGPGLVFDQVAYGASGDPGIIVSGTGYTAVTISPGLHTQIAFAVYGTGNTANGVLIQNSFLSKFGMLRVYNLDGFGVKINKMWDSIMESVSVELCGNASEYAFSMNDDGDTCNMSHIMRLQVERSNTKAIYISPNTLSCVIDNIHSEQAIPALGVNTWTLGGIRCIYNAIRLNSNAPAANSSALLSGANSQFNALITEGAIPVTVNGFNSTSLTLVSPEVNGKIGATTNQAGTISVIGGTLENLDSQASIFNCTGTKITNLTVGFANNNSDLMRFFGCQISVLASSSSTSAATFNNCIIAEAGSYLQGKTVLNNTTSSSAGAVSVAFNQRLNCVGSTLTGGGGFSLSGNALIRSIGSTFVGNMNITAQCASIFDSGSSVTGAVTGQTAPSGSSWSKGERTKNLAPAVGSPKAWVCTVAGSPGTWVSEGNL